MSAVGGMAAGGWQAAAGMRGPADGAVGVGAGLAMVALMMLMTGTVAVIGRRRSAGRTEPRGALTPAVIGRRGGLDGVRVTVGPWPAAGWRPVGEVLMLLLWGGPLPVEVDGRIRWLCDGEHLRLGTRDGCARHARPLRDSAVWMGLAAPGASPVRDPAVRP